MAGGGRGRALRSPPFRSPWPPEEAIVGPLLEASDFVLVDRGAEVAVAEVRAIDPQQRLGLTALLPPRDSLQWAFINPIMKEWG